ncbi:Mobile element protein [Pseudonocardia sp. Ae263_Ps1]|nr:Mobile element protein [Pseudonocardia sp. Ae150A_Ps1]OLL70721.1 Mobile element protein [Pseudonocardia sp. Ae263_Ps1]
MWAAPPLPGSTHDLTAARRTGAIDAVTSQNIQAWADKAYQGAGGTVRTPYKRHRTRPRLSPGQKAVNRAHARIRCRVEQAVAELKRWHVVDRFRCCPHRAHTIIAAITVLNRIETRR